MTAFRGTSTAARASFREARAAQPPLRLGVTQLTLCPRQAVDLLDMEIVIFCVVGLIGVIYGYFTVTGSGISEHPHGKIYSGAPGASRPASASGRDDRVRIADWSRGTR